jgi:N utilization substance protein A
MMDREFFEALRQLASERNIDIEELEATTEAALASAYKKHVGATGEVTVRIDTSKGKISAVCEKEVVGIVTNPYFQMSLEQARKKNPNAEIGDFIAVPISPETFGRIAAQSAKQILMQKLRESERKRVFEEFESRVGEVVSGIIQRRERDLVYVQIGRIEAIMPRREQAQTEPYRFNDRLRVYVLRVEEGVRGAVVTVSRTHPGLLRKLFELEVPEIEAETVVIHNVVREPGQRSKISVSTTDPRVDPIGACVGHRGSRVNAIVDELYGEKVDIIPYSDDPAAYITAALSPAKVNRVTLDEEQRSAYVVVPDTQLSLAIGKGGQNVRLAARLTEWKIDIRSESQAAEEQREMPPPAEAAQEGAEAPPQPERAEPEEAVETASAEPAAEGPSDVGAASADEAAETEAPTEEPAAETVEE